MISGSVSPGLVFVDVCDGEVVGDAMVRGMRGKGLMCVVV